MFFEAAARRMSFTAAASELFVSQTAVSKRIHQLEDYLGVQLFIRNGRALSLSDEGRQLRDKSAMALEYLESAVLSISARRSEAVRIAANSAVSMFWLSPRLKQFGLSDNACAVNLMTSDITNDLVTSENDLTIIYGDGTLSDFDCTLLFSEELAPVAAPEIVNKIQSESTGDLFTLPEDERPKILNYTRIGPDWINWEVWGNKMNVPHISDWPQVMCKTYTHTIGRAIEGEGIALGSLSLIEDELKSGKLVKIGSLTMQSSKGYYVASPVGKQPQGAIKRLQDFLLQNAPKFS
ncbi:LysR family transcriptional regulator [Kiloniella sp.]|uniref:LysR family transcriptional regulator n=1 Tax=Kiloniella sp. TaxID=1938587 RepID=UPI003B0292F8